MAIIPSIIRKPQPSLPIISRPFHYSSTEKLVLRSNYHKEWNGHSSKASWSSSLTPRPPPSPNRRLLLLIYTLSSTCSVTAIILFSIVIPLWDQNFIHSQSLLRGDWTDGLILAPLSLSFLFSTYLLVTSVLHQKRRQSHRQTRPPQPFYRLLLCTTLLVILVPTLVLSSSNSLALAFRSTDRSTSHSQPSRTSNGFQICTLSNILTRACLPVLYRIGEMQIGAIVLTSLVAMLWLAVLVLSVRSCIQFRVEEKRRREQRRRRRRRDHAKGVKYDGKVHSRDGGSATTSVRGKELFRESKAPSQSEHRPVAEELKPNMRDGSNAVRYARHQLKPKRRI